jgi:hypothetical protein
MITLDSRVTPLNSCAVALLASAITVPLLRLDKLGGWRTSDIKPVAGASPQHDAARPSLQGEATTGRLRPL